MLKENFAGDCYHQVVPNEPPNDHLGPRGNPLQPMRCIYNYYNHPPPHHHQNHYPPIPHLPPQPHYNHYNHYPIWLALDWITPQLLEGLQTPDNMDFSYS